MHKLKCTKCQNVKCLLGQTPYAQQYMGMYAPPQQPPPQNNSYNNYSNSYFGQPNANYGIFGPQAQPPSNASLNQVNINQRSL